MHVLHTYSGCGGNRWKFTKSPPKTQGNDTDLHKIWKEELQRRERSRYNKGVIIAQNMRCKKMDKIRHGMPSTHVRWLQNDR